jgi:hypothetical protein
VEFEVHGDASRAQSGASDGDSRADGRQEHRKRAKRLHQRAGPALRQIGFARARFTPDHAGSIGKGSASTRPFHIGSDWCKRAAGAIIPAGAY